MVALIKARCKLCEVNGGKIYPSIPKGKYLPSFMEYKFAPSIISLNPGLQIYQKYLPFTISSLISAIPGEALGVNHYGKCSPQKCGSLTIRFPFYTDHQEKYCGMDGFKVLCKDNIYSMINISYNMYMIKNIWYDTQKFQIVNSALAGPDWDCFDSLNNISLVSNERLRFAEDHSDILVFPNCSNEAMEEYKEKKVKCRSLAVYKNDTKVKYLERECNEMVTVVPYYEEGESGGKIVDVLLRGILLHWNAYDCNECMTSGGECGYDANELQLNCYCPDRTHALHCVHKNSKWPLVLGIGVGGSIFVLSAAFILIAIFHQKKLKFGHSKHTFLWAKGNKLNQNVEAFLKRYGSLAPKRYTYSELRKITNNFKEIIGEGGYGAVYKGKLYDNRSVAIKKLKKLKDNGQDFFNEVLSIGRTNHVNVVTLLGFCSEGDKRALVYEFLPNGSLEKFIRRSTSGQSLPLETLFSIAVGIAKGLDYLHRGCNMRILHFDIKPHNILLDEELCPKISDFGLARLCPTKGSLVSLSEARGTIGYIAPEVFLRNFGGVSHKSDVYSYGMMLLDLVCGQKDLIVDAQCNSELQFPQWIYSQLELGEEIASNEVMNDEDKNIRRRMILIGLWCIQTYPSSRPSMKGVLEMLEGPLESLQFPPKPYLSSPPKSMFDSGETPLFTSS